MVTIQEARLLLEQYFAAHPPAIVGELYIAPDWREDDEDYLPSWGSREFLVEGREAFARWDNLAIFIDKRTGEVRKELFTPNFDKIANMTVVTASA
jgi:hypothetical protein